MITIGLTGGSGSGKSYVAEQFHKHGIPIINADKIVHKLYATKNECTLALKTCFGDTVLNPDHSVNRAALREIVFQDRTKLALLNQTVHPFVVDQMRKQIRAAQTPAVLLDAPQLFESGLDADCTVIIAVIADPDTRIKRICERDSISDEAAKQRIANQYDDAYFISHSDFCIYNTPEHDLEKQITDILHTLGLL